MRLPHDLVVTHWNLARSSTYRWTALSRGLLCRSSLFLFRLYFFRDLLYAGFLRRARLLDDRGHIETDTVIGVSIIVTINLPFLPHILLLFLHGFVIRDLNFDVVRVVIIIEIGVCPLEVYLAVDVCGTETAALTIASCPWGEVEIGRLNWLWNISELGSLTSVIDWVHILACVVLVEERRRGIVQGRS